MILLMWITYPLYSLFLFLTLFVSSSLFPQSQYGIKYTQPSTIPFEADSLETEMVEHEYAESGEILYQVNSEGSGPLFYYSNIRTGVCLDSECRPLNVTVYWNITGRYLGFALPEKEFLSKYEHEPFTPEEYERLNMLLADSLLPLGNISFEALIQKSATHLPENAEVDGVSGATSQEVLNYVIEGAAYTTHKLWNIIHGPAQNFVERLTLTNLSGELITTILQSPDVGDRFWALKHLNRIPKLTPALQDELLNCISDKNYSLGVAALSAIDSTALHSDSLQMHLLEKFYQCRSGLNFLIIDKLKEAPRLTAHIITVSSRSLPSLNGKLLASLLDLYRAHNIRDGEVIYNVASILESDNRFVSKKAFKFLKDREIEDPLIQEQLRDYELSDEGPD